mmetsp:Transcript_27683/g.92599  ORF Transcript_27683/g.92599 Transcript_27683/m.92599 type:complete len:224 (-) Transcript_27683:847-1518(-)
MASEPPPEGSLPRDSLRWKGHLATVQRRAQHALSAFLQHQKRWTIAAADGRAALQALAGCAFEAGHLDPEVLGPLAQHTELTAGVHARLGDTWEAQLGALRKAADRLQDACAGMRGAADGAAGALRAAEEGLGAAWAADEPLFAHVPLARLCALAESLAGQYERELALRRRVAADVADRGVGAGAAPSVLTAYLAAWIMEPCLSDAEGESPGFVVHVLGEEIR